VVGFVLHYLAAGFVAAYHFFGQAAYPVGFDMTFKAVGIIAF
jgi:hypothetical protein